MMLLHDGRERRLVDAQGAGACRAPAIMSGWRFAVDVTRRSWRAGMEERRFLRCRAGEGDGSVQIAPCHVDALGHMHHDRIQMRFRLCWVGWWTEAQGIAIAGDAELHRRAGRILLGIAKCSFERPVTGAENHQVKREGIVERAHNGAPTIGACALQRDRHRVGLRRAARDNADRPSSPGVPRNQ